MITTIPRDPETGDAVLHVPEVEYVRSRVEHALEAEGTWPWVDQHDPWAALDSAPDADPHVRKALEWVLTCLEEATS